MQARIARMDAASELFPLGIAVGPAHCDRAAERGELADNLRNGVHTWIWARRRMGKTSLIEQVLRDLEPSVASAGLDLLVVHDAEDFVERLRGCVEQLGARLAPRRSSSPAKLAKAFAAWRPEFSVGAMGLRVKLAKSGRPGEGIAEMLLSADAAAAAYGRRAVLVMDEFQQIAALHEGASRSLEGAVRHAVERAGNLTYVFSGSEKHLLASMFEDEDRALYRLCRKMTLGRIGASDYRAFLDKASRSRWSRPMASAVIGRILALTGRHPHYVNALCASLWRMEAPPSEKAVESGWDRLVEEEAGSNAGRIARLAPSQRALLRAIATREDGEPHPTSHAFLARIRLPVSTGARARDALEREDLIQREADGRWTVVDPAMAAWLRRL
ncbi:MAG: hypothetical protein OXJ56_16405 [Rhodospirillaceae bacterium]|nr:hypothetical protein [Rhodospirillaceae bacterium]